MKILLLLLQQLFQVVLALHQAELLAVGNLQFLTENLEMQCLWRRSWVDLKVVERVAWRSCFS